MRDKAKIKEDFLDAIKDVGNIFFENNKFEKKSSKIDFTRKIGSSRQLVSFTANYLPKYEDKIEIHLFPKMSIYMPCIKEKSLELVGQDRFILANAPDLIINQPIEFTAPKAFRVEWCSTGREEIYETTRAVIDFIGNWTLPLLDNLTSPIDLIRFYESNDSRMMKQTHWYIFVASSYCIEKQKDKALAVLQNNIKTNLQKIRYSAAFDALRM